jgi:hypothetical protein
MMLPLRRMERHDKMNHPGASDFYHGQPQPFIADIKVGAIPVTVIIDEHGIEFSWGDFRFHRLPSLQGADLLNVLWELKPEMSAEFFQQVLSDYCCQFSL